MTEERKGGGVREKGRKGEQKGARGRIGKEEEEGKERGGEEEAARGRMSRDNLAST